MKTLNENCLTPKMALDALEVHKEGKVKRVHTFTSGGIFLMGCDMDLSEVETLFNNAKPDEIQMAGRNMCAVSHAVGVWTKTGWMFISTKPAFTKIVNSFNKSFAK